MRFLSMLGGTWVSSWEQFLTQNKVGEEFTGWLLPLMNTLSIVLWVILALVGAAGGIYAVYVGIKMARADSAEARDENKKRLINIIVSIIVVIVLILFFNTLLPGLISVFSDYNVVGKNPAGTEGSALRGAVRAARLLLRV